MAEGKGADGLLLGGIAIIGKAHHRHGGSDALIAAAWIGHDRDCRATHARVAGGWSVGNHVFHRGVAIVFQAKTTDGGAKCVAIIPFKCGAGGFHIEIAGTEDEVNLFQRGFGGKFIYRGEVELYVIGSMWLLGCRGFLHEDFATPAHVDIACVFARDDHPGRIGAIGHSDVNVEVGRGIRIELYVDTPFWNIGFTALHGFGGHVAEHFKTIVSLSDERAKGHGDG